MTQQAVTGGCLCGACQYGLAGPLAAGGICYCGDCRRVTGSAFGVSFRASKDVLVRSGETRTFSKPAESGIVLVRHFCPHCGSPLYTESQAHPDAVFVKAGSLDDPGQLTLDREMWTVSRVTWAHASDALETYPKGR